MRSPHTSYRCRGERVIEPIKWMRSPHTATGGEERESRSQSVYALTTPSYRWRGERVMEPIKCMRSPHTSYRWRGERVIGANQVYALATHQLQVERRERHRAYHVDALANHQLTGGEERES